MANKVYQSLRDKIDNMKPEQIRAEIDEIVAEILEMKLKDITIAKVLSASLSHAEVYLPTYKAIIIVKKITQGSYTAEVKHVFDVKIQEIIQTITEILDKPFAPKR